jgi:hypothetical protein
VPDGVAPLRINLDETSISFFQGGVRGTVFITKRQARTRLRQNVPRAARRCCLTHVALICDSETVQPRLPQFIIGNCTAFRVREMNALRAACAPNVVLVRQKSAWNNETLCAQIVRRLALALASCAVGWQPILVMDAAKLHLTRGVFAACSRAHIWPLIVPPKLTSLLQPLDTHAFMSYKHALQEAYQVEQATGCCCVLPIAALLRCVCESIRATLEGRCWASAFDETGFGGQQRLVGRRVRGAMGLGNEDCVPVILNLRPSDDLLALCFPRRARVPVAALWRSFDVASAPASSHAPPPHRVEQRVVPISTHVPDDIARGRTRSATFGSMASWAPLASRVRRRSGAHVCFGRSVSPPRVLFCRRERECAFHVGRFCTGRA